MIPVPYIVELKNGTRILVPMASYQKFMEQMRAARLPTNASIVLVNILVGDGEYIFNMIEVAAIYPEDFLVREK